MRPKACADKAVSRSHSTWRCEERPYWRCSVPRRRVAGGESWIQVFMKKGERRMEVLHAMVGEMLWLRSAYKAELRVQVLQVQGTARRLDLLVLDCCPT